MHTAVCYVSQCVQVGHWLLMKMLVTMTSQIADRTAVTGGDIARKSRTDGQTGGQVHC